MYEMQRHCLLGVTYRELFTPQTKLPRATEYFTAQCVLELGMPLVFHSVRINEINEPCRSGVIINRDDFSLDIYYNKKNISLVWKFRYSVRNYNFLLFHQLANSAIDQNNLYRVRVYL